jgi:hypothetical protein
MAWINLTQSSYRLLHGGRGRSTVVSTLWLCAACLHPHPASQPVGDNGRSHLAIKDAPLILVDGVQLIEFQRLKSIPAATLHSIEILNGLDGTTYYCSNPATSETARPGALEARDECQGIVI